MLNGAQRKGKKEKAHASVFDLSGESFSQTHHQIVDRLGTILSHLKVESGILAAVMSWGDTQNSEDTLIALTDYIERFTAN